VPMTRLFVTLSAITVGVAGNTLIETARAQQAPPEPVMTLPDGGVEVPLRLQQGRPIVEVRIDGKGPYTFLIDTAAAGYARADSSLVKALNLEVVGQARGSAGQGGQTVAMPVVSLGTLQIGAASFTNIHAASRDYNLRPSDVRLDGILGFNLFRDCLVTLDFVNGKLRLEPGALPEPDGAEVLTFNDPRRVAQVAIKVASREVVAVLDTGAPTIIMLPEALAAELPLTAAPKKVGQATTVSGTMDVNEAELKGSIAIGRHMIAEPAVGFSPAMRDAILGMVALRNFTLTFDQKNKRVRFARAGHEPIRIVR
jgi:predicted aspartyl protease